MIPRTTTLLPRLLPRCVDGLGWNELCQGRALFILLLSWSVEGLKNDLDKVVPPRCYGHLQWGAASAPNVAQPPPLPLLQHGPHPLWCVSLTAPQDQESLQQGGVSGPHGRDNGVGGSMHLRAAAAVLLIIKLPRESSFIALNAIVFKPQKSLILSERM